MKQPKGLKYKVNKVIDTFPSYVTRDSTSQPIDVNNYINKINIINKIMLCNPLNNLSKQNQDKRDENIIDDPNKIIDLSDRNQIIKNIELLPNITDKLIYSLNTLIA